MLWNGIDYKGFTPFIQHSGAIVFVIICLPSGRKTKPLLSCAMACQNEDILCIKLTTIVLA